jgi:hypothetical protein
MKVTIIDKGEGFVTAKLSAETGTETVILAQCAMGEALNSTLSLASNQRYVGTSGGGNASGYKQESSVSFGSFSIPVHEVLQEPAK